MAKSSTKQRKRATTTGSLRIGNQWNAINIIARSQTHPLKAICELTENAIDAGAGHIQLVRRRLKGQLYIEVHDDGNGVILGPDGVPDFARIATHVCDSMKRHLNERERAGVHGEFGIGLLSFWSLGDELRMVASGADNHAYEMRLDRGKRTYSIRPVRSALALVGRRRAAPGKYAESGHGRQNGSLPVRRIARSNPFVRRADPDP